MFAVTRARPPTAAGLAVAAVTAVTALTAALLSAPAPAAAGRPAPGAATDAAAAGAASFFVLLKGRADLGAAATRQRHADRTAYVFAQQRAYADRAQKGLRALLTERGVPFTPYWIANAVRVTGSTALRAELAARPDVARILPDTPYKLVKPVRTAAVSPKIVDPNLEEIGAEKVWDTYGAHGEGVVVGTIDTGAEYTHEAIASRYRGARTGPPEHDYNWYDPSQVCGIPSTEPCDTDGHGTHTLGVITGGVAGEGPQEIGVAPGARWIAAKGCETDECSASAVLAAGQWMVAPTDLTGANPRPDLAPQVVNNSWGGRGGDTFYQEIVNTWAAAGILGVFAAGNDGPACGTIGSPADNDNAYAVGAAEFPWAMASFSSRGPGTLGDPGKPDIVAPGMYVYSSVLRNQYAWMDGTSTAAAHVSGAVALLWSAVPALAGDLAGTRAALGATARDLGDGACGGTPEENNTAGEGFLDVFAAVERERGPGGALAGTVRAGSAEGPPVAGATLVAAGPVTRTVTADDEGAFRFPYLPAGRYEVTARAYGHVPATAAVTVEADATTSLDVALAEAARYEVTGHVRDHRGAPVAAATVRVPGTPLQTGTDDGGAFRLADVPAGDHDLVATARGGCLAPGGVPLRVVDADVVADVTLAARSDRYGYTCEVTEASWVETDRVLPLGDAALGPLPVPLPFTVNLYERPYTTAHVYTNGLVTFERSWWDLPETPGVPDPAWPNAAVYAFFTYVGASYGDIRTGLTGTAPDRRFALEWVDVPVDNAYPDSGQSRLSFQIVFYESGPIALQYRGIGDQSGEQGAGATIGIENETGTIGLLYSSGERSVADNTAVLFRVPGTGFVRGTVTDANDGGPVADATVTVSRAGAPDRTLRTDAAGRYRARLRVGPATVRIEHSYYTTARDQFVLDREDTVLTFDAALRTARVTATPAALELVVPPGQRRERTVTLGNTGTEETGYEVQEAGGGSLQTRSALGAAAATRAAADDPGARDTRGLAAGRVATRAAPPLEPLHPRILRSWPTRGVSRGWGVGFESGTVWVSDARTSRNASFTTEGTVLPDIWPTPDALGWPADMAYVPDRGLMCQVDTGLDTSSIFCWDPRTGKEEDRIEGLHDWVFGFQRALAYRPDTDTFYVGGWTEGVIYQVKGFSHPDQGEVVGRCAPDDPAIAGLAWNGAHQRLWMSTNSELDLIYSLNPDTCETISVLEPPDTAQYSGAGLELDPVGNLWTVSQGSPATAYLLDSGLPNVTDVPWLSASPAGGTLAPGASQQVTIRVDTTGLAPGLYGAYVIVRSESGRDPALAVPVRLVVPGYQAGLNAGGSAHTDALGDRWAADQPYAAGGRGYLANRSRVVRTRTAVAGTAEQPLYQDLREGAYEYRFDNVPDGVYEVELRFAELQRRKPDTRLFDVLVEGQLLVPRLDVVNDAGTFAALDHTLTVTVTDGQLNVRLVNLEAETILNAIRVTHRPDRIG